MNPPAKFPLKSPKPKGFSKLTTRIKSVAIAEEIETDEQILSNEEDEYENETDSERGSSFGSATEYNLSKPGFPFYEITAIMKRPRFMFMENFKLTDFYELNRTNLTNRILKRLPMSDDLIHQLFYSLIEDARQYAHKVNFSNGQGWALMDMFYHLFMILAINYTQSREEFYELFRETLVLYTYNEPPFALRTYTVLECFGIEKLFEELFEPNYDVLRSVFFMPYADIKIELK